MKTIGIIGGMSAASTQIYYRTLVDLTRQRLGGLHSPEILLRSIDFAPIADAQAVGDWDWMGAEMNRHALALQNGGAELMILATNTMHKLQAQMLDGIDIPFVHIADATAQAITKAGHKRPALMATAFTMEQAFYTDRLRTAGLDPLIPDDADRAQIHQIIYDELCKDITTEASQQDYIAIAERLRDAGADSLILGCTEVGMLLNAENCPLPVFDTALIHCESTLDMALA